MYSWPEIKVQKKNNVEDIKVVSEAERMRKRRARDF